MKRPLVIAALNTDPAVSEKLEFHHQHDQLELSIYPDKERFLEFVNYELPDLTIYNFAESGLAAYEVLNDIKSDPWLHYGGIIGLCQNDEEENISALLKDTNLIALIPVQDFDRFFPRLLRIIKKNRSILFQRHLQKQLLTEFSGSFVIDNDPFDLAAYTNLVANYLANAGLLDHDGKERLKLALQELLFNAVEHGNCAITFDEKSAWLAAHKNIFDLIREKNRNPKVRARKVDLQYTITRHHSVFTIEDQGNGFDWKKREATGGQAENVAELDLHGRGISLTRIFVQDLTYNKKGNKVTFTFAHAAEPAGTVPGVFRAHDQVTLRDGQVVFKENDESDTLYYIVSGRLDVYAEGKKLSTLTSEDFFVGEMSFLIGNRRTATVKSSGRSVLLALSKKDFLTAMRTQPHYSIFLARLLAHRLEKLNRKAGRLL
jgi:anti-sigma regulatory factor (Ser/Thr protein kinase)